MNRYQQYCLDTIISKIDEGAKHISVVMILGMGRTPLSLAIANSLKSNKNASVSMVFSDKRLIPFVKNKAESQGVDTIAYYSFNDFLNSNNDSSCVMFFDLTPSERKRIQILVDNKECTTISFSSTPCHLKGQAEGEFPVACIFATNKVIDINDARYAGECEVSYVNAENTGIVRRLSDYNSQTKDELGELKQSFSQRKNYIEQLNSRIHKDNDEIENLKAQLAQYQVMIEEKETENAQLKKMISLQQEILYAFDIDKEVVISLFDQIETVRNALESDLSSEDTGIKEIAEKQLESRTAEIVSSGIQSVLLSDDRKYFEEYLIGELSEAVWNKLDDSSKTFLVTAKSTYEFMIKTKDKDAFDYSGVCLLVTKALEVEVAKRFFSYYKRYLTNKYSDESQWPNTLRKSNGSVMQDKDFTIGSVVHIAGYYNTERESKKNNPNRRISIQPDGSIDGEKARREFITYIHKYLFDYSDYQDSVRELGKDLTFIETVRLDYRNPAAHRGGLNITDATNCLNYVVETQQMLRKMLSAMKI